MIIWDILFLEGTIVLFKAALGIFKIMKKDLMQIDNVEELNYYLENREFSFHDISEVVYFLLLRRFEFDNSLINRLRKTHEKKIMKEMNYYTCNKLIEQQIKFEQDLKSRKLAEGELSRVSCLGINEKCNLNWPLCIYDKFFKLNLINYLYFKTADDINIIEQYFYSDVSKLNYDDVNIKTNNQSEKEKLKKISQSICDKKNMNNSAKKELDLTKVFLSNTNLTLKDQKIQTNLINDKRILNQNSSDFSLNDNMKFPKYSTPETKKYNSVLYSDSIGTPKICNLNLNTFSKKENHLHKNLDIKLNNKFSYLMKNNNEIIFVDNENENSNEENNDSLNNDDILLLAVRNEELNNDFYDDQEDEKYENRINLNDYSFDNNNNNNDNSYGKRSNKLSLFQGEEKYCGRKSNHIFNCTDIKIFNEKSENLFNKRPHSNELKKIKDIKRENEKRIKVYRSLLINRRKHYCQIINQNPNERGISKNYNGSKFLTAEINKSKKFYFKINFT